MKTIFISLSFLLFSITSYGQEKFLTKQGEISFFSSTPVEDIEAENNQVLSIIDTKDGSVAIAILMKSFLFEKSLMQEHFNENYVESDTYPKATLKGKILNFENVEKGDNEVIIKGEITIHGITQQIETKGVLIKSDELLQLNGKFDLSIGDFNIEIPTVVAGNISENIAVTYALEHKPYN